MAGPMKNVRGSRREFLKLAGLTAGACVLPRSSGVAIDAFKSKSQIEPNEVDAI
jgi:hypothetical protein